MEEKKNGVLFVLSGPAGSGKGTVVNKLIEKYPGEFALSISCTTREKRNNEKGNEYHFISAEEFDVRREHGEFLEWAKYCTGNSYGTPADFVTENLKAGRNVILEIDIQGGKRVREVYPHVVLIMIAPPDYPTLEHRLRDRHTETEESITKRLHTAKTEIETIPQYDYLVINEEGQTEKTAEAVYNIIAAEKMRTYRYPTFLDEFYGKK